MGFAVLAVQMRASLRSSISVFLNWKFSSSFWRLCLMSRRFPLFGPSGLGSGVAEVAVALNVPAGTVKTRLMHARRTLRAVLEGDV